MEAETNTVVFVDDDADVRRANTQTLKLADFDVRAFESAEAALRSIDAGFAGVVVTDMRMPVVDGNDLFQRLQEIDADIPVIFITGHGDIAEAVETMRAGAYDFIAKPFPAEKLVASVRRALEKRALVLENRRLRSAADIAASGELVIGESPAIVALRATVRQIADADVDVLIEGETGVGKELLARALHMQGARRSRPFVVLNCEAIPEAMAETELFGHEAGVVAGVLRRRAGRVEAAEGGTLFLDDIDAASPALQTRLTRIIEDREITPVGATEPRHVRFRAVASVRPDLATLVDAGLFRRDLFYRLNVVRMRVPPLRERRVDIPLLFAHFLAESARKFRRAAPNMSDGVRRRLLEHDWPGNVRELQHFAERVVLGLDDRPTRVGAGVETPSLPQRVEQFEENIIRDALALTAGDVRKTLEYLQIPRKTLYDKLKRFNLDINSFRQSDA
ncbi:MAG: sigma-54 dependent transcriptional regulator [Hyphomonadaceae bacterium]